MYVSKIHLMGYKSISDATVPFSNINVLIGGNGVGKSNLISSFELLRDIYDRDLQRHVLEHGGANSLLHLGRRKTDSIMIDIETDNNGSRNRYCVDLKETDDKLYISKAYTSYLFNNKWRDQICDTNQREASISTDRTGQAYYVGPLLKQFEVFHFHDTGIQSPMKGNKNINDNKKLKRDGSNIAPFLYYLSIREPQSFQIIEKTISLIVPSFKSFELSPNRLNPDTIRLEWSHVDGGDNIFNDSQLSDGSLRFICLATLLLQPNPPQTIIIDEPELGLHPQAINFLVALVRKAAAKSQIIISTQSASLVDQFSIEDIIVVNKTINGSVYERLDKDALSEWLREYSLGEMWEMNIFGGQPL